VRADRQKWDKTPKMAQAMVESDTDVSGPRRKSWISFSPLDRSDKPKQGFVFHYSGS
jgi:hypothetical protein